MWLTIVVLQTVKLVIQEPDMMCLNQLALLQSKDHQLPVPMHPGWLKVNGVKPCCPHVSLCTFADMCMHHLSLSSVFYL